MGRLGIALMVAQLAAVPGYSCWAQSPDPAPGVRAAIARLDFMVGRWRGTAWQQRGTERVQTQMLEVVEPRLNGTVLLVEGRGTVPEAGGTDRVVHHALGLVSFDPRTNAYTLRYLSTGQYGDFTVTLVDGG